MISLIAAHLSLKKLKNRQPNFFTEAERLIFPLLINLDYSHPRIRRRVAIKFLEAMELIVAQVREGNDLPNAIVTGTYPLKPLAISKLSFKSSKPSP